MNYSLKSHFSKHIKIFIYCLSYFYCLIAPVYCQLQYIAYAMRKEKFGSWINFPLEHIFSLSWLLRIPYFLGMRNTHTLYKYTINTEILRFYCFIITSCYKKLNTVSASVTVSAVREAKS